MPTLENFSIVLEGNQTVYRGGDELSGHVYVRLGSGMRIKTLVIVLLGQGRVEKKVSKTWYINTEEYVSDGRLLYDECQDQHMMGNYPPGEYRFPFNFRLPAVSLPTSFQGEFGFIRYWLSCTLKRHSFLQSDEKRSVMLMVVDRVNIDEPALRSCRQNQEDLPICCWCCAAGTINIIGKIDRGAYYPGEEVCAKIYVDNGSSRDVTYTEVKLEQLVTYKYGKGSDDFTRKRKTLASVKGPGVKKQQESEVDDLKLTVPAIQPTTKSAAIISISYEIELIAHVKGACVCAPDVTIPITIGQPGSGPRQALDPRLIELLVTAMLQQGSSDASEEVEQNDEQVDLADTARLV